MQENMNPEELPRRGGPSAALLPGSRAGLARAAELWAVTGLRAGLSTQRPPRFGAQRRDAPGGRRRTAAVARCVCPPRGHCHVRAGSAWRGRPTFSAVSKRVSCESDLPSSESTVKMMRLCGAWPFPRDFISLSVLK